MDGQIGGGHREAWMIRKMDGQGSRLTVWFFCVPSSP